MRCISANAHHLGLLKNQIVLSLVSGPSSYAAEASRASMAFLQRPVGPCLRVRNVATALQTKDYSQRVKTSILVLLRRA